MNDERKSQAVEPKAGPGSITVRTRGDAIEIILSPGTKIGLRDVILMLAAEPELAKIAYVVMADWYRCG